MPPTTLTTTSPHYHTIRPYNPSRDRSSLEEICVDISDYLPKVANSYVNDDSCSFLVLSTKRGDQQEDQNNGQPHQQEEEDDDDDDDAIIAVANYKRLPAQNAAWIEAVRTHPHYRNQGLASKLLQSLIELAKEEDDKDRNRRSSGSNNNNNNNNHQQQHSPTNVLTCTVKSNKGMQRVFEKLGFVQTNRISMLSFSVLRQLPGWGATENNDNETMSTTITTSHGRKPLLDALDLHHLISSDARSIPASSWTTVKTETQLLELLKEMQRKGGTCGFLPGLHEYIVPGPNRLDLKQSLERGLVLALNIPLGDKEMSGCDGEGNETTTNNGRRSERAILAFTQDERISSLESNWVCSISAHSTLTFEAALYHAHSSEIAQRINGTNEMVPFCLTFDDTVPVKEEGTIAHALPRVDDECLVFSYKHM